MYVNGCLDVESYDTKGGGGGFESPNPNSSYIRTYSYPQLAARADTAPGVVFSGESVIIRYRVTRNRAILVMRTRIRGGHVQHPR